jgi:hypothetical protein
LSTVEVPSSFAKACSQYKLHKTNTNLANKKEIFGIQKQHETSRRHKSKVVNKIRVIDLSSQDEDTMYKPKPIASP